MKKALGLLLALAAALPAAAQQRLGDVAGGITLKKPAAEAVVVDDAAVSRPASGGVGSVATGDLVATVEVAAQTAKAAADLVRELPWITPTTYDQALRDRLQGADFELERLQNSLALFAFDAHYGAALDLADAGIRSAREGLAETIATTTGNRAVATETRRRVADGARQLQDALADLRAVARGETATAAPPPLDPITADATMRALCGRKYYEGSEHYESCLDQQRAAFDVLLLRSGASFGIDEASFNRARNECRLEWPQDFVARDSCERQRAAAGSAP
jgi:hypothetical protein